MFCMLNVFPLFCLLLRFTYFAMLFGNNCYGFKSLQSAISLGSLSATSCNMVCNDKSGDICGGTVTDSGYYAAALYEMLSFLGTCMLR